MDDKISFGLNIRRDVRNSQEEPIAIELGKADLEGLSDCPRPSGGNKAGFMAHLRG